MTKHAASASEAVAAAAETVFVAIRAPAASASAGASAPAAAIAAKSSATAIAPPASALAVKNIATSGQPSRSRAAAATKATRASSAKPNPGMPRAPKSSTPNPKRAVAANIKDVSRMSLIDAARISPYESHYRVEFDKKGKYEAYLRKQANSKAARVMVRMLGAGRRTATLPQALTALDNMYGGQAAPELAWAVSQTWRMHESECARSQRHYAASKLVRSKIVLDALDLDAMGQQDNMLISEHNFDVALLVDEKFAVHCVRSEPCDDGQCKDHELR